MNEEFEMQIRRVLQAFDYEVATTNRERFAHHVGDVKHEDFTRLAKVIAELRARYMKAVLDAPVSGEIEDQTEWAGKLRNHHFAYSEAMAGFNELRHALERGYFSIVE